MVDSSTVLNATRYLAEIDFPLYSDAEKLMGVGAKAPFEIYLSAASSLVKTLKSDDAYRQIRAARKAASLVDEIAEWIGPTVELQDGGIARIACRKGCHYCCYLHVTAGPGEVANVLEALDANRRAGLRPRLADYVSKPFEPLRPRLCPLNVDGECTVYSVRPIACRIHHSYSLSQCELAFTEWRANHPISRNAMRKICGEAVALALAHAFDFCSLDAGPLSLIEGLADAIVDS